VCERAGVYCADVSGMMRGEEEERVRRWYRVGEGERY
jgi:hypothetical protein